MASSRAKLCDQGLLTGALENRPPRQARSSSSSPARTAPAMGDAVVASPATTGGRRGKRLGRPNFFLRALADMLVASPAAPCRPAPLPICVPSSWSG